MERMERRVIARLTIVVTRPNPGLRINQLNAVATSSVTDAWAEGTADTNGVGGLDQTLTEHETGTSWKYGTSPNRGTPGNVLDGVAEITPKDVWAVGYDGNTSAHQQTLIEHGNGTA